jgi:chaperonin GroES
LQNTSGIKPCDVKVLVLPEPPEERTKGGIIITETIKEREKFAAVRGRLIATGSNAFAEWGDGNGPEPGSRISYAQYAGKWLKGSDGVEYLIMNDEDVIARLDEANG